MGSDVDGLGWLFDKVARVMSAFPKYDWEDVTMGMTGAQSWALHAWAVENEARVWGGQVRRSCPGYVRQETLRLFEERKK